MKSIYGCCLVLVASMGLMACDAGRESKATVAPGKNSYVLTDRETIVLKALLEEEIDAISEGVESAFPDLTKKLLGDFVVTTSAKLQEEYERNEVAGDQQFRKKVLLVNGIVKSIDRSVGENYFIGLKGGSNPFMTPKAAMADGYTNFLASLKKGTQVWLVCRGNGMLIGSAMLADCVPLYSFSRQKANDFVSKLNIGDAIEKAEKSTLLLSAGSIAMASSLPDSSPCFSSNPDKEKCLAELKVIANSKNKEKNEAFQSAYRAALEKIGVNLDALKAASAVSASK